MSAFLRGTKVTTTKAYDNLGKSNGTHVTTEEYDFSLVNDGAELYDEDCDAIDEGGTCDGCGRCSDGADSADDEDIPTERMYIKTQGKEDYDRLITILRGLGLKVYEG